MSTRRLFTGTSKRRWSWRRCAELRRSGRSPRDGPSEPSERVEAAGGEGHEGGLHQRGGAVARGSRGGEPGSAREDWGVDRGAGFFGKSAQVVSREGRTTTRPHPEQRAYPYLLKEVAIERPNQVWSPDITYIPLQGGFLCLVAVMDWATRRVLSWRHSSTLDAQFGVEALIEALTCYGHPETILKTIEVGRSQYRPGEYRNSG